MSEMWLAEMWLNKFMCISLDEKFLSLQYKQKIAWFLLGIWDKYRS